MSAIRVVSGAHFVELGSWIKRLGQVHVACVGGDIRLLGAQRSEVPVKHIHDVNKQFHNRNGADESHEPVAKVEQRRIVCSDGTDKAAAAQKTNKIGRVEIIPERPAERWILPDAKDKDNNKDEQHAANLRRLLKGEEPRIGAKSANAASGTLA